MMDDHIDNDTDDDDLIDYDTDDDDLIGIIIDKMFCIGDDIDEDDLIDAEQFIDTKHLIGVDPAPASALESAVQRDKLAALAMRGLTKYLDRGMTSAKINAATDAEIEAMFTRYKMMLRDIIIRYDCLRKKSMRGLTKYLDRGMTPAKINAVKDAEIEARFTRYNMKLRASLIRYDCLRRRVCSYTCTDSKQQQGGGSAYFHLGPVAAPTVVSGMRHVIS